VLEEARAGTPGDADWARLGAFYGACMDEPGIEAAGIAPLQPLLDEIAAVKDVTGLMAAVVHVGDAGAAPLYEAYVSGDAKNPDMAILYLSQGGLGLPDRDYYLDQTEERIALRGHYVTYLKAILGLTGDADAEAHAAAILAFEAELAAFHLPRADLRDPVAIYNKVDLAGLQALAPGLPWKEMLRASGDETKTDISVHNPAYFTALDALIQKTPPDVWRAYLTFQLADVLAYRLPKTFVDAQFAFARELTGQEELPVRWKRRTARSARRSAATAWSAPFPGTASRSLST
jgi:predicted metalloendopeptidase